MFDICIFNENWRMGNYYDALLEDWNQKMNWGNIPFSYSVFFLIKANIEFLKGKNIVLYIPTLQLVSKSI